MKITAKQIELAIVERYNLRQNLFIPNVSWGMFSYECDLIMMSKSGCLTEFEIKISAGDLKKDKLKKHGHINDMVRYLFFVFPEKLLKYEEYVPERAGIFIYKPEDKLKCHLYRDCKTNVKAKSLSIDDKFKLARLGSLRIWKLKSEIEGMKNDRLFLLNQIKELELKNKS
jgi:hypothetical protein